MSKALVEIVGDATSYLRATKQAAAGTDKLSATVKELKVNTQSAAQAQVAATVKKQAKLREEIAIYQQLSSSAKRGSAEQIAAANHAAQSQQRLSRSLGVSARESRHLAASSKVVERDFGRMSRGALSASLSFRGMGRSLAFASGYFLGGAGVVYGIKSTIAAAEESQRVLGQTANAVRHSGNSWADYGKQIRAAALAQSNVAGFDDERLLGTFGALVRRTKDVNQSLRLNALAANVARGANIQLEQAAKIVLRASVGQARGLSAIGIAAKKGATGVQLLSQITAKYAGSAQAFGNTAAGAQARFQVAVENLQEAIGAGLLPTLTRVLNPISDWLNESKNQERVQHDVSRAVRTTVGVLHGFISATKTVTGAVGGFRNVLGVLLTLKVASTLAGWATAFRATGGAAATASLEVQALRGKLRTLATLAPIVITIDILENLIPKGVKAKGQKVLDQGGGGALGQLPIIGPALQAGAAAGRASRDAVFGSGKGKKPNMSKNQMEAYYAGKNGDGFPFPLSDPSFAADFAAYRRGRKDGGNKIGSKQANGAGVKAAAATAAPLDRLSRIQNTVAQARVAAARGDKGAQTRLVAALKAQIDFDRKYEKIQAALVAKGGKDAKKHAQTLQALYADETSALGEITSMNDKALSKQESAAKKAAAAAKKRRDAARKAAEKRAKEAQTFTVPMALQIAAAKAATTASTKDDAKIAGEIEAFARKMIRSGKKKGQALVDAWNEIATQMNVLSQFQTGQNHAVVASAAHLTAGIKFASVAARRAEEARIAQALAHGGHVPTGHAVSGQTIDLHNHVYLDGREISRTVTKHQQREGSHAAVQTRGPHAGRNTRVH